ncbi:hypothetical protein B9Z19DRAFT_1129951 [Tuber borchii]|uniref:Type I restriction enzyme R protein N-terminal domain-containing protein n=1 Tax=Tuber borchii TaxID=42251 RepID=A0A2T6ZLF1_TUBBO|nr:hypothetical protein B9Z19DRAFT_1129951 [Tuber borchii]
MPLLETIYEEFEFANDMQEIQASQLYQPYYVLLSHLFPPEEGYIVVPHYNPPIPSRSVEFKNIYTVKHNEADVLFFLQVKSSEDLSNISSRQEADLQMQEKFRHITAAVRIGMLYGVCAMGTKICIYRLHVKTRLLSRSLELVTNTAPVVDCWNIDILTPEGQGKLCKIAQHTKEMSTQIRQSCLISD